MNLKQKNKLIYARAGFGISCADYLEPKPVQDVVDSLFPSVAPTELNVISADEWQQHSPKVMRQMTDIVAKKEMQKAFRKRTHDLNGLWMKEMVDTKYPLQEKMALFWHGHFATRLEEPYYDQKLLHILRANALGNFGDLLKQVSKSSAMLQFLNNQQNKKEHPNENFAREVMELFTIGRGHYTEEDVKEAARAFTGWAYDGDGEFIFRKHQHDDGQKKFLGKVGYFTGDDILDILLQQKQTAVFITQKIYRFFVSDEQIDEKRVKELAADFYASKYDIKKMLQQIFTADWFYKSGVVGAKVKSPIELLVGYQRLIPLTFINPNVPIQLQRILGQTLFTPPNVAGWPGGKNWINSSSLVVRMRLPEALFASRELDLSAKDHDPEMGEHMNNGTNDMAENAPHYKVGKITADWSSYLANWTKQKQEDIPAELAGFLLTVPVSDNQLKDALSFADHANNEDYIKSYTILLMGLPEYQLT